MKEICVLWIERAHTGSAAGTHLAGTLDRLAAASGVLVTRVIAETKPPRITDGTAARMWRIFRLIIAGAVAARKRRVLFCRFHPLLLPVLLVWKAIGAKTVVSVQGVPDTIASLPKLFTRKQINALSAVTVRMASAVIVGAPPILEYVQNELAHPGQSVSIIANGISVGEIQRQRDEAPPMEGRYVVFVGNLAPWQGVDVMAAAVRDKAWPEDVPLVVVGSGVEEQRLQGVSGVVLVGPRPHSEAMRWLVHATCALSLQRATDDDGTLGYWPYKVLESTAAGVPIVCTRTRHMDSLASLAGNVVVVPPADPHACAVAVAELVGNESMRYTLAQMGLANAHRFSWEQGSQALSSVLCGNDTHESR